MEAGQARGELGAPCDRMKTLDHAVDLVIKTAMNKPLGRKTCVFVKVAVKRGPRIRHDQVINEHKTKFPANNANGREKEEGTIKY